MNKEKKTLRIKIVSPCIVAKAQAMPGDEMELPKREARVLLASKKAVLVEKGKRGK